MSDYLSRLIARSFSPNETVRPLVRSIFEPHKGASNPASAFIFDEINSDASSFDETSSNSATKFQHQDGDLAGISYHNKISDLTPFQPVDMRTEKHIPQAVLISESSNNFNKPPAEGPPSQIDEKSNLPSSKEINISASNPRSNRMTDKPANPLSLSLIGDKSNLPSSNEIESPASNSRTNRRTDKPANPPSSSQISEKSNLQASKEIDTLPSDPRTKRNIDKTVNPPLSSHINDKSSLPSSNEIESLASNPRTNRKIDKTAKFPFTKEIVAPLTNLRESQQGGNYDTIPRSADLRNLIKSEINDPLGEAIRTPVGSVNQNILIEKSESRKRTGQLEVSYGEASAGQIISPLIYKNSVMHPRTISLVGPYAVHSVGPDKSSKTAPSVEVTIGRIEVRATSQPPHSHKQRTSPPLMSLDEYLEQRSRGGY